MLAPLARDWLPYLAPAFRRGMAFIWRPEQDGNSQDSAPGEPFLTRWGVTEIDLGRRGSCRHR